METDACRGVLAIFANSLANEVELKPIGFRWYLGAGAVAAESIPFHSLSSYLSSSLSTIYRLLLRHCSNTPRHGSPNKVGQLFAASA
jgi:hypothetical protein